MDGLTIGARGISLTLDLAIGHIADLTIEAGGRILKPLHRAPWVDEPVTKTADWSPGTKGLSGDFLCAPFSTSDVEPAPLHGWSANSRWQVVESHAIAGGSQARLRLERRILGTTVEKVLTLRDGHPFLYQEHTFIGGNGELPAAHHPMTAMREGGRIAFSPKRLAMTPDAPLEPDPSRGRYALAYPGQSADLTAFPRAGGGTWDLTRYSAGGSDEDFVILVEAPHSGPGWTAVARQSEVDLVMALKDPAELPVTMLWLSNGGRDYAPWNGRHRGVLGIEDGRTAVGHRASLGDNPLSRMGVATSFRLRPEGEVRFRHVIGAAPLVSAGVPPLRIETDEGALTAIFANGETLRLPFDDGFLAGR